MHVLVRLLQVNLALWGYLGWWAGVSLGVWRARIHPAQRLAFTLERLGTTFVKIGQGLSLHRELLPDDYVAALQKLQDHVEPFDARAAQAEIEASFGRPVGQLFASFDPQPLAAGSIAQVHTASMPDGRRVIIKVRRPGIRRQVREDLRLMRWFVRSVLLVAPWLRPVRPLELIDELAHNLRRELDFRQEAGNIARFVQMFQGSGSVFIPAVVDDLYSEWVIVQEMSRGRRIDAPQFMSQGPMLASHLVDAYLRQLVVEGVFHGDPHPGNLFVLEDGRICFHDFGLVGYLDKTTRLNLVAFMLAFVQQDSDWLLDAYLDLGMLAATADRAAWRAGIEELMQDHARKPLRDWSFGEVLLRVTRLGGTRNVRLPHHLLVLLRAVFLLESTVRRLDPSFSLVEGLFLKAGSMVEGAGAMANAPVQGQAPAPTDRLGFETFLSGRQLPDQLGATLHRLRTEGLQMAVTHRGLENMADAVRESGRSTAQALLAAGLYVGASLLLQSGAGPRWGMVPVLPALGYAIALWLTWRVLHRKGDS